MQVVPEVVVRVHALLPHDWDWSGAAATAPSAAGTAAAGGGGAASEEAREAGDLQRAYYALLLALVQNQLSPALLQARVAPAFFPFTRTSCCQRSCRCAGVLGIILCSTSAWSVLHCV